jgi:hypothetical protein
MNMVAVVALVTVTGSSFEIWAFSDKAADDPANHKKQATTIEMTCFIGSPHTQQIWQI